MADKKKTKKITKPVTLDPDLIKIGLTIARSKDRSFSSFINWLIRKYAEDHDLIKPKDIIHKDKAA